VKTQTVTSAGGVVIDLRHRVLMISRRSPAGRLQWTLPKGLVEKGEDAEETAVREVREETGVAARVTGEPHTIDYWFVWKPDDTRYHKYVRYYPMQPTGEPDTARDDEAESVEWVDAADAIARASFANEKTVLRALTREDEKP
jgi:8-oxo-dGTP pyrophosphatase MutT (NUDIX family)